ncbi:hypothetical protein Droror1_Dr00012176 [Drosera rotundifolia]
MLKPTFPPKLLSHIISSPRLLCSPPPNRRLTSHHHTPPPSYTVASGSSSAAFSSPRRHEPPHSPHSPDSTSPLSATRRLCSLCLHRRTMSRQRGRKIQGGAAATAAANKGCYVGYFGRWVNGFDGWMWWIGSPGW